MQPTNPKNYHIVHTSVQNNKIIIAEGAKVIPLYLIV
jgi:hypothetical protein